MHTENVVAVSRLTQSLGSAQAVRDVLFEVRRGEIFGLLGPNVFFVMLLLLVPLWLNSAIARDPEGILATRLVSGSVPWLQILMGFALLIVAFR